MFPQILAHSSTASGKSFALGVQDILDEAKLGTKLV